MRNKNPVSPVTQRAIPRVIAVSFANICTSRASLQKTRRFPHRSRPVPIFAQSLLEQPEFTPVIRHSQRLDVRPLEILVVLVIQAERCRLLWNVHRGVDGLTMHGLAQDGFGKDVQERPFPPLCIVSDISNPQAPLPFLLLHITLEGT